MNEIYMAAVRDLQAKLQGIEINAMILGGDTIVVDVPRRALDQAAAAIGGLQKGRWLFTPYRHGAWQGYELEIRGNGR